MSDLPFRTGRRVPRNIYQGEEPIAMVATEELAARLVRMLNIGLALTREGAGCQSVQFHCPAGECNGTKVSLTKLATHLEGTLGGPVHQAPPKASGKLREAAQALLDACVKDFGYGDEEGDYPDADDNAVGGGAKGPMAVQFGHMRKLRDALT